MLIFHQQFLALSLALIKLFFLTKQKCSYQILLISCGGSASILLLVNKSWLDPLVKLLGHHQIQLWIICPAHNFQCYNGGYTVTLGYCSGCNCGISVMNSWHMAQKLGKLCNTTSNIDMRMKDSDMLEVACDIKPQVWCCWVQWTRQIWAWVIHSRTRLPA